MVVCQRMEAKAIPMSDPTVSVLMPVYNCERYLDEAIRSIREQTFTDFEFVIVNDGSTDGSLEIIQRHAEEDERIIILDRPNGGIVAALNAGLAVCRGEFIARMDGDDVSLPERFERQVAYLRQHPQIGVLGGWAYVIDNQGIEIGSKCPPSTHEEILSHSLQQGWTAIIHPASVIRRVAFGDRGYEPDYAYAEDTELFFRIAGAWQLANLTEYLLRYRCHVASASSRLSPLAARLSVRVVRDAMRNLGRFESALLSQHCYRASWLSGDEGRSFDAFRFGALAWCYAPSSVVGPRAVCRAVWRYIRPRRITDCDQCEVDGVDKGLEH